jgi:hypothetical protein
MVVCATFCTMRTVANGVDYMKHKLLQLQLIVVTDVCQILSRPIDRACYTVEVSAFYHR